MTPIFLHTRYLNDSVEQLCRTFHFSIDNSINMLSNVSMSVLRIVLIHAILMNSLYSKDISFTQTDRDRLIRLEVKVEEGIGSLQRQVDDLRSFLLWGFGLLFGGMSVLIGFIIVLRWKDNSNKLFLT